MPTACAACRKLKMRCSWTRSTSAGPCDRCLHNGRSCFIPQARKVGRKVGSSGRYQGVDKALRNLQLALKKAEGQTPAGNDETLTVSVRSLKSTPSPQISPTTATSCNISDLTTDAFGAADPPYALENYSMDNAQDVPVPCPISHNQRSIKSNPLWLIADASREALAAMASQRQSQALKIQESHYLSEDAQSSSGSYLNKSHHLLNTSTCVDLGLKIGSQILEEGLDAVITTPQQRSAALEYFKYRDINVFPDTGPDLDPIEQGLVTAQEAQKLFPIYFERVNPISCILDPQLHTVEFVRSRSALLFTWILAITAQFEPEHSALATRLRAHGERLCKHVYTQGFKSTEIVQGYYIYLHTATPAPSYGEERVWLYTAYAFGSASHLYLDEPCRRMERGINASPPIVMDYEFLSRNRERTWLRILAWEKANSAVGNRVDVFPDNDLLLNIETWWRHPLATSTDKYTCAFITLRQRITTLHSDLRRKADIHDHDPHWIEYTVDNSLAFWHHCWMPKKDSATQSEMISDIYLRFLYIHARLGALSFGLSTSFKTRSAMKAVAEDCFHCAVECCETVVQDLQKVGEPLYLMMTPIWAMVCYAAVLALKLFPILYGNQPGADAQLIALLSQVALQLERAGSTPPPRYGLAALLGQHLKMILETRLSPLRATLKQPAAQMIDGERTWAGVESCNQTASSSYTEYHNTDFTNFDSVLTAPMFTGEEGVWQDDFGDFLQDLFGQRFGQ